MIFAGVVAVFAILAVITYAGTIAIDRAYPLQGDYVDVKGARLRIVQLGPRDTNTLPVVMVHGASANLETMRQPLGELIAKKHRVILVDRPGHGGSLRDDRLATSPSAQAAMIDEALARLGVSRAVFVVHSWAGALGTAMALEFPQRVAGLVMLAPVTHPWTGGVGIFNKIATLPVIGTVLAYTLPIPLGWFLIEPSVRAVFAPQTPPAKYAADTMVALVLRPNEFLANAFDLVLLKSEVVKLSPRNGEIKMPVTIFHGDADKTVSLTIHSQAFARDVRQTKLVTLPNVGHMPQNAVPDQIAAEIDRMVRETAALPKAAAAN